MSKIIIGIDEVGRGPLAGPVLVTALAIPEKFKIKNKDLPKLKDSKQLTEIQRNKFYNYLKNHPIISYATSRVLSKTIDKINISRAANCAATKAFKKLVSVNKYRTNTKIFLDGGLYLINNRGQKNHRSKTIIKGDEKINAIKLASIVAKVTRDKYMTKLHKKYPKYGFNENKGYGTKKHMKAIKKYGLSKVHRLTFC